MSPCRHPEIEPSCGACMHTKLMSVMAERDELQEELKTTRSQFAVAMQRDTGIIRRMGDVCALVHKLPEKSPEMLIALDNLSRYSAPRTGVGGYEYSREKVDELTAKVNIAKKALDTLSRCGGGCEGPMGCMCMSGTARRALDEMG